jgi:thymidylate synthase
MNKHIDEQYLDICKEILEKGTNKSDRTGTGTKSIFSAQIKHDMSDGFPLLNTKRVYWKGVVTELIWFLRGDTNIKWLLENDNNIWVGDAYKNYLTNFKNNPYGSQAARLLVCPTQEEFIEKIKTDDEFANEWGELGPIYGVQWCNWNNHRSVGMEGFSGINQIQQAIDTLKTNPDSRRIIVSAWNVGELDNMVLPPCHWAFELYTEELTWQEMKSILYNHIPDWDKDIIDQWGNFLVDDMLKVYNKTNLPKRRLSLKWHQRSVDVGLGLGFNIASYGLLLEILAKEVNMVPGTLIGDLSNVHLYNDHIEPIKEQLLRKPFPLPKLNIKDKNIKDISEYNFNDFELIGYKCHPTIKMPLSN